MEFIVGAILTGVTITTLNYFGVVTLPVRKVKE